ncbi:MAG: cupin domain-containing protein [Alphaproteobacteria bacterium]|nr:cupin domain-containing protein [Alphaproteobacteria bacterium]
MSDTPILIRHSERPTVTFPGGADYCPVIGDDNGAGVAVRTGIQTSPPGYETRPHSHPYVELLTVLEGEGEAWVEGEAEIIRLEPGVTIALPANRVHSFRTLGNKPLVTYGIHTAHKRIVNYANPPAAGG